jgi:mitochondrial fission protein ELM1
MTIAPTPVDRVRIREKGRRFREERNLVGDNVWAVLIGGDGAGYHFDGLAMETLADALLALAVRHGARLLVTTSRRTGFKLEETLMKRFHNHPAVIHATFFNHRPEKVMEEFLGSADMVFCTADSGSMITEAIAAGRPVYVWEPVRVEPEAFYQSFLDHLCTARHIKRISSTQLDSVDVNQDKASYFQLLEKEPICEFAEKIKPWFESATEDVICRRPDDA